MYLYRRWQCGGESREILRDFTVHGMRLIGIVTLLTHARVMPLSVVIITPQHRGHPH